MPRARAALITYCVATLTAGCVHSVDRAPQPAVELPPAWAASAPDTPPPDTNPRWWQSFQNAGLNALIRQALDGNQNLAAALARLDAARAVLTQRGAALFPELQLEANASRGNSVIFIGDQRVQTINNRYQLSAGASYEVDLWGRVRNDKAAAQADALARALDAQAAAHSIAAETTETWLTLIETRARLELIRGQVDTAEKFLELTRLRFQTGAGSIVAIRQQEQQLAGLRAQAPTLRAQITVLRNQLAVLIGRAPGVALPGLPQRLPQLPPPPASGVPADVLLTRPDVAAARARLVAADHRVGAAVANRLPSLRLSADAGYQAQSTEMLLDDLVWSIAAGIVGPIFDAGRRAAEVTRTEAVLREALANFTQTTITALAEVENALAQEAAQRERVAALETRVTASRETLDAARRRYANGLSDYLPVLNALTSLQGDEQTYLTAQRQLLSFRVQLHRALGGDWAVVGADVNAAAGPAEATEESS